VYPALNHVVKKTYVKGVKKSARAAARVLFVNVWWVNVQRGAKRTLETHMSVVALGEGERRNITEKGSQRGKALKRTLGGLYHAGGRLDLVRLERDIDLVTESLLHGRGVPTLRIKASPKPNQKGFQGIRLFTQRASLPQNL
jgi:hypothetical protein